MFEPNDEGMLERGRTLVMMIIVNYDIYYTWVYFDCFSHYIICGQTYTRKVDVDCVNALASLAATVHKVSYCLWVCASMCVCVFVYMFVGVPMLINNTCTCVPVHVCVSVSVSLCVCTSIYIYMKGFLKSKRTKMIPHNKWKKSTTAIIYIQIMIYWWLSLYFTAVYNIHIYCLQWYIVHALVMHTCTGYAGWQLGC